MSDSNIRAQALEEAARALEAEGKRMYELDHDMGSLTAIKCYDNAAMLRKMIAPAQIEKPPVALVVGRTRLVTLIAHKLLRWNRSLGEKPAIAMGKELIVAHKVVELVNAARINQSEDDREFVEPNCWCWHCLEEAQAAQMVTALNLTSPRFIVCPTCHNKRCPRASDHRNDCGHSNAHDQIGSYTGK